MAPATQTSSSDSVSPIGFGSVRTDLEFDMENLSEEEQDVVGAEEFIVFGQANIEQWDDPEPGDESIYIMMDALEEKLDQFFALENISWHHKDVRVGEPLREYTLDNETTIHLDTGESLNFDAGDTLQTEVIREGEPLPDGSGEADEDALWLVANIYGRDDPEGSILSQATRLGAYTGNLDGFSVTIDKREIEPTDEGYVVHDLDFLACTVGEDDLIKNPGSTFGVAEFQMIFADDASTAAGAEHGRLGPADDPHPTHFASAAERGEDQRSALSLKEAIMGSVFKNLFTTSREGLASEAIRTAHEQEMPLQEAAAAVGPEDDEDAVDQITQEANDKLASIRDRLDQEAEDRESLAAEVADELGMDKEEVMAIFEELDATTEEGDEPDDGGEDDEEEEDEDDDENAGPDQQANVDPEELFQTDAAQEALQGAIESQLEEMSLATEGDIEDRIESVHEDLSDQIDDLGANLSDELVDTVSEEMATGTTSDPAGGNATGEADIKEQAESWANDFGASQEDA